MATDMNQLSAVAGMGSMIDGSSCHVTFKKTSERAMLILTETHQ